MNVAATAATALGNYQFLARLRQIAHDCTRIQIAYRSSLRHGHDQIRGSCSRHLLAHPVLAIFSLENPVVAKVHQGSQARIDL